MIIYGLGGLGFNALQVALSIGARIIVVEKRQEILDYATKFGVKKEDTISDANAVAEYVKSKKILVDTAIDFVGVPDTFNSATEAGKLCRGSYLGHDHC